MDNTKLLIADNIKRIRESLGYTQTEFAQKLNYSDKAISKWERADSIPDIFVLKSITDLADLNLDYLVCDHSKEDKIVIKNKKARSHYIVTFLSIGLVWLIATLLFIVTSSMLPSFTIPWIIFIAGGIVTEVVVLIFNSIWGKAKLNYIIISALVWNCLVFLFLAFFKSYPIMFVLGAPGQIIIILWSLLKPFKKTKNG